MIDSNVLDELYRQGDKGDQKEMPQAVLKFILVYKETGEEIGMPVLYLCEEYSSLSFCVKEYDENENENKYHGIGRLPSYEAGLTDDTTKDYNVYVDINGVRHKYAGEFYKP